MSSPPDSAAARDVTQLGQVFTPPAVVERMLALRMHGGRTLEPACGDGAFSARIPDCLALEVDARVAPAGARIMDFFDLPDSERFDTIIGNPPYVRFQDILPATREKLDMRLFDSRSNLYLFFIEKSIRHLAPGGELIFITPRDFIKSTGAHRLNQYIFETGSITDFIDLGDARIFRGALPNCAIFRFEKGRTDRTMHDGRRFDCHNGQLVFLSNRFGLPFGSLFSVRVGAVSGADRIFTHPDGNVDFVFSKTAQTGQTRRMLYNIQHPHLAAHKDALLARRVKPFSETNWWRWGRDHARTDAPRVYVNNKTRRARPFFTHPCPDYDGAILAIFPHDRSMDVAQAAEALNDVPWEELGFVCDGRYLFAQRSLQHCMLPEDFAQRLLGR